MLWLCLLVCGTLMAQTGGSFRVKGIVLDSLTREGEPYATLKIARKNNPDKAVKAVLTDLNGAFSATVAGQGDFVLTVSSMGREPLVRDRIAFTKDRGTEEEKEARMIAQLCNLSEQDIWLLTAADYAQLTDAFNVFMLPPGKRPKPKSSEG